MFKKIISILLCLFMVSVCVYATEDIDTTDIPTVEEFSKKNVYTLTLEQAINMALTDNPQLNACLEKKEDTRVQLKSARETKSQYRELTNIPITTAFELVYIKNGYYVHTYEKALKLSDSEYEQIKAQISYKVTEKYFTLKNCEKLVEIAKNSYNLVLTNYTNASLCYELGMISKSELDSANVSLMQAMFTVQSYENNYNIAKEDFKIAMNKNNENCDFVLTDTLDVVEFTTNLTEDLVVAENSRYDIAALKMNYELSEEYLNLTLGGATARKSAAKSSFITAEYNYTNNKSLILLGLKASYNNISSSRNNVTLTGETLNLKKNSYDIAKIQYEQGLITNTELLSALNNVYTAEVEYENAKLNYRLSVDKYKYDVQIGI